MMRDIRKTIIRNGLNMMKETRSSKLFLFLNSAKDFQWFFKADNIEKENIVIVIPGTGKIMNLPGKSANAEVIACWSGNQTRFSRIKYAFLHAVLKGIILPDSRVVCVLGPSGKSHLDTVTIHDLSLSWSEEFPFNVQALIDHQGFNTVMAVIDIALDIGALGREGKSVGTIFVIGDTMNVLKSSHQAVFNPFKGYPRKERFINFPEVVESIKELAKLDGAIIISSEGVVEAAGRNLDVSNVVTKKLRGLGSRHRAAAGITKKTEAIAIVVSESTGRVMIFQRGSIAGSLEPLISRRMV